MEQQLLAKLAHTHLKVAFHSIRKDLEETTVSQDVKDTVEQAIAKVQEAINNEDKEQITQTVSELYVAAQPLMEAKNNPTDETVVDAKVV